MLKSFKTCLKVCCHIVCAKICQACGSLRLWKFQVSFPNFFFREKMSGAWWRNKEFFVCVFIGCTFDQWTRHEVFSPRDIGTYIFWIEKKKYSFHYKQIDIHLPTPYHLSNLFVIIIHIHTIQFIFYIANIHYEQETI